MKHLGVVLAFLGMVCSLIGAEAKNLRIPVGSLVVEEVPFKIENVSVSSPGLVRVEIISDNGRQFRISGLKTGITDVQLLGGGMSQVYKVTVSDDLREMLNSLKRDLDAVPEVDISMNNGKLVLKGELSSIANQTLKDKVVKSYGSVVLDLTTFRPTPEVMLGLQKNFEKAGFKVVRNAKEAHPGEISITQVGEMLTVSGSVYGPDDLKKINSILSAQPWLTVNSANSTGNQHKVQAYVNVQVLPVMLQIDIIHIALSQNEIQQIGNQISGLDNILWGNLNLDGALSALKMRGLPTTFGGGNSPGGAVPGTGGAAWMQGGGMLSGALAFLGGNGVSRARRAGFLTFKSNDTPQFRKLHNGGTLYMSSVGVPGGTVVTTLTEIQYGLILEVKGGLTGVDTVSIELKQELSYPENSAISGVQVDLKKFSTTNSITCKLGEPIAVGGLKEFIQENTNSDSIPYLRNIPGLKWLIAQEKDTFKDDEILTLICVRKMVPAGSVDPVAVELDKMKQAEDKVMRERNEERQNRGWWFW